MKSYREWYSCDALITDRHDGMEMEGHPMASAGYISVLNPGSEDAANVTVTFYHQNVEPTCHSLSVPPQRTEVVEVHKAEASGERNRYYGVKISSDITVFPHWTRGEYESWGEHCPTAMFGVVPYRGPLKGETEWYYADGFVQDDETHPLIQTEWVSILNSNSEKTDVTFIIYTRSGPAEYRTEINSQSVKLIKMEELEIVPEAHRYGVCVRSTLPIVVQQTRRSLVKRGTPSSKSTFATTAVPLTGNCAPWESRTDGTSRG